MVNNMALNKNENVVKFDWYLHETYMRSEIEERLRDQIGDHPDIEQIIEAIRNVTYEYEINFAWDE